MEKKVFVVLTHWDDDVYANVHATKESAYQEVVDTVYDTHFDTVEYDDLKQKITNQLDEKGYYEDGEVIYEVEEKELIG